MGRHVTYHPLPLAHRQTADGSDKNILESDCEVGPLLTERAKVYARTTMNGDAGLVSCLVDRVATRVRGSSRDLSQLVSNDVVCFSCRTAPVPLAAPSTRMKFSI